MNSQHILFISKKYKVKPSGGREMLSALNFQMLRNIYSKHLFDFEISEHSDHNKETISMQKLFHGEIDGVSNSLLQKLMKLIDQHHINQLFIDGSNLGKIAELVKSNFPHIQIHTFFHNVEAKFFFDSFVRQKTLHSFGVLVANYFAEKKAVQYSDTLICLTNLDSILLEKVYGRKADSVSAIALDDKLPIKIPTSHHQITEHYVLFVGGLFYANEFGIKWFAKNVSPKIGLKTYIVGRGFESLREQLEKNHNVKVIGAVENLADYYLHADYVIAPIFEGSGMKTKVAEAFMFGKKIVATDQALVGYDNLPLDSYYACNTEEEFINALKFFDKKFDQSLRDIYQQKFSPQAAERRLKKILLK
jgi:polysaccharide biosynthesis protein PslH